MQSFAKCPSSSQLTHRFLGIDDLDDGVRVLCALREEEEEEGDEEEEEK